MANVKSVKVVNPGILEVPEGSHVWNLTKKHILNLIKSKGKAPVSKAVQNLLRWNKNKKADKLKSWAKKAATWVHEAESVPAHANLMEARITTLVQASIIESLYREEGE